MAHGFELIRTDKTKKSVFLRVDLCLILKLSDGW